MELAARGFIFRVYRLTESSLIAHWLTAEHGRIATVAKGALRPKSPFRGKLDLFFEARCTYLPSKRSELHSLKEVELIDPNSWLRTNLPAFKEAARAAGVIEECVERETPAPEIHRLFAEYLQFLKIAESFSAAAPAFEAKLLERLGLDPAVRSELKETVRKLIACVVREPFANGLPGKTTSEDEIALRHILDRAWREHLGHVPKANLRQAR